MKKLLLLSLLFCFVLISKAQESAVTRDISAIDENNEITVTISVKVDQLDNINLESFARIEERVPEKCECIVIDAADSDTNFKLRTLKFIWFNNLPKEDFQIKYKIKVLEQTDDKCIDGVFNYLKPGDIRDKVAVEGKKCFE